MLSNINVASRHYDNLVVKKMFVVTIFGELSATPDNKMCIVLQCKKNQNSLWCKDHFKEINLQNTS